VATNLSNLKPADGAKQTRKRVGRGPGSGNGKTAGRGNKGAQSRSGYSYKRGFEGGQMPLHRRMPKRGFNNHDFRHDFAEVNLGTLQKAVEAGRLQDGASVDGAKLVEAGVLRRTRDGVRLLGKGELKAKLTIEVAGASKSAVEAVEKAGGSVTIKKVGREYKPTKTEPKGKNARKALAPPPAPKKAEAAAEGAPKKAKKGGGDAGAEAPQKPKKAKKDE
jgi:large subunit ribosomal protein L15